MAKENLLPAGTQARLSTEAINAFGLLLDAIPPRKRFESFQTASLVELELRKGAHALSYLAIIREYYITEVDENAPFVGMIDKLIPREEKPPEAPAKEG